MVAFLIILAIFILLFSVRVGVKLELNDELRLTANIFGIRIRLLPKKQKKYRLRDYTPKKIAKREAKAAKRAAKKAQKKAEKRAKKKAQKEEEAKLTREERREIKRKKKEGRPAAGDLIGMFSELAKLLCSNLFSHLHIKASKIHIKVGGADAAQISLLWYGIYASCGGLIALLDKYSNVHGKKNADIEIVPDYLSEKIQTDLVLSLSMNLFGFFTIIFKLLFKGIIGWVKIQPASSGSSRSSSGGGSQSSQKKGGTQGGKSGSQKNTAQRKSAQPKKA